MGLGSLKDSQPASETALAPPPSRAAFAFIFITVTLDMLALGIMAPVLPKLIIQFEGGAMTAAARITGVDASEPFLAEARRRMPGASFRHGDVTALDLPDAAFDAALSLLVLQFVPDRTAAVAEMARVVRPGGLVAAAMWDFTGGFSFLRTFVDSIAAVEPDGEAFRARYWSDPVGTPGRLSALLAGAGLAGVAERDVAIRQEFSSFADWWEPWAQGGQGVAGAYVASLPPERLPRVEALARRAYLAGAPDGPRSFVAVARLATGLTRA